jgi:hypothetical protein
MNRTGRARTLAPDSRTRRACGSLAPRRPALPIRCRELVPPPGTSPGARPPSGAAPSPRPSGARRPGCRGRHPSSRRPEIPRRRPSSPSCAHIRRAHTPCRRSIQKIQGVTRWRAGVPPPPAAASMPTRPGVVEEAHPPDLGWSSAPPPATPSRSESFARLDQISRDKGLDLRQPAARRFPSGAGVIPRVEKGSGRRVGRRSWRREGRYRAWRTGRRR